MIKNKSVLIIGSGGREHALGWKLKQSPKIGRLYFAPGNPGTAKIGENIPINAQNLDELAAFAKTHSIDLTVVGPDDALAMGAWHRLHYSDYVWAKAGHRFCTECLCVEPGE